MKRYYILWVLVVLFVLITSCAPEEKRVMHPVPELPEAILTKEFAMHLRGLSTAITADAAIQVQFNEPQIRANQIYSEISKEFYSLTPSIEGRMYWQDRNTIHFQPVKQFPMNVIIKVELDLQKLVTEKAFSTPLKWDVLVEPRKVVSYEAKVEPAEVGKYSFRGTLSFNTKVSLREVSQAAVLLLNNNKNKPIQLTFEDNWESLDFTFSSEMIEYDKRREQLLTFIIPEDKLDLDDDFERSVRVPMLKSIDVISVVASETERENSIEISFSENIDPAQSLQGLISVSDLADIRFRQIDKRVIIHGPFVSGQGYNVFVSGAIRNPAGENIGEDKDYSVTFYDQKPRLLFTSSGCFLSSENEKSIRFQTMNVKKVKLTLTRVYGSNIGQFLQTERLDSQAHRTRRVSDRELHRVGVPIANEELNTGEVKNRWLTHQLDLSSIIPDNEIGLYIVELSFTQNDILYDRAAPSQASGWSYNYYEVPTSSGYYSRYGSIYKPLVLSDIGLSWVNARNKNIVYATNIRTNNPLSGVEISLMDYQNQLIAKEVTDRSGKVEFDISLHAASISTTNIGGIGEILISSRAGGDGTRTSHSPSPSVLYVQAKWKNQTGIIQANEMAWNYSTFDVEGVDAVDTGTRGYIYSERGVHRPGDTVNLAMIFRNANNTFPRNHPVSIKITNPRNQEVLDTVIRTAKDGFYSYAFDTKADFPTGNYNARITAGGSTFNHRIRIETVVPERLKIQFHSENEIITNQVNSNPTQIQADYLIGTPGAELKAVVECEYNHRNKTFPSYETYLFSREEEEFKKTSFKLFDGNLDNRGKAKFNWNIPDFQSPPSAISARINAEVWEPGGRTSKNWKIYPVEPYNQYIGISIVDDEDSFTDKKVQIVLLDEDGKPVVGKPLSVKLYNNRNWWWWEFDSWNRGRRHFKTDQETMMISEDTIFSALQPVTYDVSLTQSGRYYLEVTDMSENGHTAARFLSRWATGDFAGGMVNVGLLTLSSDKTTYKPGDKAVISFPVPPDAQVLVSIDRGGTNLQTFWHKPRRGETRTTVSVDVNKNMVPNIYCSISVIQPHSNTDNDRPLRMFGVIPLRVEDVATKQQLTVKLPDELKPNSEFICEIQASEKTQFTIAVVDEGLLSLTRFNSPDAWTEFNKKLRLSARMSDNYSSFLDVNRGDVFRTFSVGGDSDYLQALDYRDRQLQHIQAERFKAISLFKGPLETDDRGYAKVSFYIPDYVGAVRVMIVSAKEGKYGNFEKTLPVRTELMAVPTLPRVLAPNDVFEIPVHIISTSDDIKEVTLECLVEGPIEIQGPSTIEATFSQKGEKIVRFKATAKSEIGIGKISIKAKAADFEFRTDTDISVRPLAAYQSISEHKRIPKGETVSFNARGPGFQGTNRLQVTLSKQYPVDISRRLNWLVRYPFGCIEQIVSGAFPQIYLKHFSLETRLSTEVDNNINSVIRRLVQYQLPNGSFSYWQGGTGTSEWGTNYAIHFLLEAQKNGYFVPEDLLERALIYLSGRSTSFRVVPIDRDNLLFYREQLYRLYLLSLANRQNPAAMNLMKEVNMELLPNVERLMFAACYQLSGDGETANTIKRNATIQVATYNETGGTYGSDLRDKGIILSTLLILNDRELADKLYNEIAEQISSDGWYSTQTIGYSLLSLGKYMERFKDEFSTATRAGGEIRYAGNTYTFDTTEKPFLKYLDYRENEPVVVFANPNNETEHIYAMVNWEGIPKLALTESDSKRLNIERVFTDMNGSVINPRNIKQGQTFRLEITAKKERRAPIDELALVQILPSGWEIENQRLIEEELARVRESGRWRHQSARQTDQFTYEYVDIRDDRIMWFFKMGSNQNEVKLSIVLKAVTAGNFIFPSTQFEAMYDNNYRAVLKGFPITVTR